MQRQIRRRIADLVLGVLGVMTPVVRPGAAAEVAVALAIILAIYRSRRTVNIEDINLLKW